MRAALWWQGSGLTGMPLRLLEALAFSSLWVTAAAGALTFAASRALGIEPQPAVLGLALTGTLFVYGIDRLRDLPSDRATAPRRSAFVEAHREALARLTLGAGVAAAACALALGARALGVLAPVAALGLLHRRLKRMPWGKALYIAGAWVGVVVGLPAVTDPAARHATWAGLILGGALVANAIASNLRDDEGGSSRLGTRRALRAARALAVFGAAAAGLAPASVRPLAAVPLATLAVLVPFRDDERYGLIAVDGALLAGALVAIAIT